MPYTNYWNHPENPVEQLFWGRVKVERAVSFLFFEKGSIFQHLFHELKYNGKKELGILFGRLFGKKLTESNFDNTIDVIVPVPLHKSRQRKRGYNQSEQIAIGISESLKKPVCNHLLIRQIASKTQTRRSRYERWQNVEGIFKCTDQQFLENKHVLIVDDVITTGATTEALIQEIAGINNIKISVATLAIA